MDDLIRLKAVLAEKKKTSKWLAEELGVSITTVSRWCTNSSKPDLDVLVQIAKLLGVGLNDLVRFEEYNVTQQK